MSIRVRFAPSPTGALHIGGIRTALYNYLLAKKYGGTFLLRIEDTDQTRFVEGAEQYIINALNWCGIAPTEGVGFGDGEFAPYRQSDRMKQGIYKKYALQLVESGKAYYAFDTPEELDAMRERLKSESHQSYSLHTRGTMRNSLTMTEVETKAWLESGKPYTIRFKLTENELVTINDLIRGEVNFNSNELDDKVLLKADGMPTYHLAHLVDDYLMGITHVIRGEEWLPSTGHHVLLYRALGWEAAMPQFAHLPLILKPDGKGKLSKRDGKKFGFPVFPLSWAAATPDDSFEGFREMGFDAQALINFLALLGWSSGDDQEIFSLEELVEHFSLGKIHKGGARFDYDKAKWFNQQYIHKTDNAILAAQIYPSVTAKNSAISLDFVAQFVGLMKERVTFLTEFLGKGYYFFEAVREYDQANVQKRWKSNNRQKFEALKNFLKEVDFDTPQNLETATKHWVTENSLKIGEALPILRLSLMGTMQGPDVFQTAYLFGKEEVIKRLEIAFEKFDAMQ